MKSLLHTLSFVVRYASTRLSVGAYGKSDAAILSYQLQIDTFTPQIAKTYVFNSALSAVKERFAQLHTKPSSSDVVSNSGSPAPRGLAFEVMVLCCALKPALAWHAEEVVAQGRERTGGQGYLACNYFGDLIAFAHAGLTAEGDSRVLWMKVSKELLAEERVKETGLLKPTVTDDLIGALKISSLGKKLERVLGEKQCFFY